MGDVTRSWGSSADETIEALDRLFASDRQKRDRWAARLESRVIGLDAPAQPAPEERVDPPRAPLAQETSRPAPAEPGWVILPRRTTHGGPFGASIIDRVAATVRKESDW